MIYADHAATTKLDLDAFEAMKPFLLEAYGNASQPYAFSRSSRMAIKNARERIAACINAYPEEIYFTSGGSESDNWVIKGSILPHNDKRAIITSQIEHHAVLHACTAVEKLGFPVVYLPVDSHGVVSVESMEQCVSSQTKLVSVMLANNETGSIQPVKQLCELAHKHGALFHTDAVQAVGHVPVDVKELNVDFLSASAHKFNGPKGIGLLYIRDGVEWPALIDGGSQEKGVRAGTENVAAIVGMSVALENNCKKIESNAAHLAKLESVFFTELNKTKLDYIRNGSPTHLPGSISISFKHANGEMLLHRLDLMGICISTGSACNSKDIENSHVLMAMKVPEEYIQGTIRITLGYENTEAEVKQIVAAIQKVLEVN